MFATSSTEYAHVMDGLEAVFMTESRLPEMVFRQNYDRLAFFEFEECMTSHGWELMQKLEAETPDSEVFGAVLEPNASSYFHRHFGYYAAARFPTKMSADRYVDTVSTAPPDSPADAAI